MRRLWVTSVLLLMASAAPAATVDEFDSDGWRKLSQAELTMTQEPLAPDAPAIYLFTRSDRDDNVGLEKVYIQIKVLSEAGRDRANIDVPYRKDSQSIGGIEARVVQPDGTIVPFKGQVFDHSMVATSTLDLHAKRFVLADVRVGSIIEYRYRRTIDYGKVFDSTWLLNQDLFARHALYSLKVSPQLTVRMVAPLGWLPGTNPAEEKRGVTRYEAFNVPAFVTEQFMPPAVDLQYRVQFLYSYPLLFGAEPVAFWSAFAKANYETAGKYIEVTDAVRKALAGIVAAGDSDEQKARKIYAHIQTLRNDSMEQPGESAEDRSKRVKASMPKGVNEIITRGAGSGGQLTLYCVALLRAAGLQAEPVLAAPRTEQFFGRNAMQPNGLNVALADIQLGGKEVLLLPGVPYLPFGELPWDLTAVDALRVASGAVWFTTPSPHAPDARTRRVADLALAQDGTLEGTVTITFAGREAFVRRIAMRLEDEQTRKERLESDLKAHLPADAIIKLVEQPDMSGTDAPMLVKYNVTVPSWAVASGGRLLVGVGLFGNSTKGMFTAPTRQHPIYFQYPFQVEDELHIKPPAGYHMASPVAPAVVPQEAQLRYEIGAEGGAEGVVLHRRMAIDVLLARASTYPHFQTFFRAVRAGDEQQVVLTR